MRLILTLCWMVTCASRPSFGLDAPALCDAAASRAESAFNLPAGLLAAVGTVETGRTVGSFVRAPWPWTVNVAGRGYYFASKDEAVAGVLHFMRLGNPLIDIGCFQVDVLYHAGDFRSLADAFDPDHNAMEAAQILARMRPRGDDWSAAVALYHSARPELGLPYLQSVRAALPRARQRASVATMLSILEQQPVSGTALPVVVYGQWQRPGLAHSTLTRVANHEQ